MVIEIVAGISELKAEDKKNQISLRMRMRTRTSLRRHQSQLSCKNCNISAKYQSMTFHGPSTTELKNAQLVSVFLMDEISVLERQMKVRKAKERL
jgi:hypothetical protein